MRVLRSLFSGIEKYINTPPPVGAAPRAPRRESGEVDTTVEAKASPETLAEIDVAETKLKAQLSLLESKRAQMESLDVSALQDSGSSELGERVQRTFTEIQEVYNK